MDVKFISKMSKAENCTCTACHNIERVMKVLLPTTLFYDHKILITKYKEYWLCCSCRNKLSYALDFPEDEQEVN